MRFPPTPSKIRPTPLERQACISVRQSTLFQVREHTAIIARDQGHSGASTAGRDGCQSLMVEVGLGHAGAVRRLDVSRLARSASDGYRVLDICAWTDTLVIDAAGVYDPGQDNDRMRLGFKGTMSEAERHWLRSRLRGGKLEQAHHGALRVRPPAGFVFDPAGQVVLEPDEDVQQAGRRLFTRFAQSGSALAVVKHVATPHLRFPTRGWGNRQGHERFWGPLPHTRGLEVLHHPADAGTYVYGRTQTRTQVLPGDAPG
jgi:DNA invertase Pin-like site-specific DNA recombinase